MEMIQMLYRKLRSTLRWPGLEKFFKMYWLKFHPHNDSYDLPPFIWLYTCMDCFITIKPIENYWSLLLINTTFIHQNKKVQDVCTCHNPVYIQYVHIIISLFCPCRMVTICIIQQRRSMKIRFPILWLTQLKGQLLCFITTLVPVNLSDAFVL
jgi:hypothetical protein